MDDYLYIVWFRDLGADPSEQDHEWPAAFLIEAASAAEATRSSAVRRGQGGEAGLPRIRYGESASNDALGW